MDQRGKAGLAGQSSRSIAEPHLPLSRGPSAKAHRRCRGRFRTDGPVADWVVVMRRFDQAALFDEFAKTGRLSLAQQLRQDPGTMDWVRIDAGAGPGRACPPAARARPCMRRPAPKGGEYPHSTGRSTGWRKRLVWARASFVSRRRSRDAAVGRVATRRFTGSAARPISSISLP